MRLHKLLIALWLLVAMLAVSVSDTSAQPIQSSGTIKYVKTAKDTTTLTGSSSSRKTITVTNHDSTINLYVQLANSSGGITSAVYLVYPGKWIKVSATGVTGVIRWAASDSVFSQVIQGDVLFGLNMIEQSGTLDKLRQAYSHYSSGFISPVYERKLKFPIAPVFRI